MQMCSSWLAEKAVSFHSKDQSVNDVKWTVPAVELYEICKYIVCEQMSDILNIRNVIPTGL